MTEQRCIGFDFWGRVLYSTAMMKHRPSFKMWSSVAQLIEHGACNAKASVFDSRVHP